MSEKYRIGKVFYTIEDIKGIAFRHGQDGIKYYPPSSWGSYGMQWANADYQEQYIKGRKKYFEETGAYPSGGCASWDKDSKCCG